MCACRSRPSSPLDFVSMQLRIRFEDGFIAYLNGVEVARRNAPADASFDAVAIDDRLVNDAVREEVIDLQHAIDLLRDGPNVLAFHVLNESIDGSELLLAPELVKVDESVDRFFATPTPGEVNDFGVLDFVSDTQFSVDRGIFETPFDLEISTATEDATIYCTFDGSIPGPDNPAALEYDGAIRVSGTTTLRRRGVQVRLRADERRYTDLSVSERRPLAAGEPAGPAVIVERRVSRRLRNGPGRP